MTRIVRYVKPYLLIRFPAQHNSGCRYDRGHDHGRIVETGRHEQLLEKQGCIMNCI